MGRFFDVWYVLGIGLAAVMTGYSIDRARSDYKPHYDHWYDPATKMASYKAPCGYKMTYTLDGAQKTVQVHGVSNGDTALMMFGTTLVMFQTPAMGIAQAGMIRRKNSLSMMMQCVSGMAIGSLMWYVVGYSMTFGPDVGGIIGDPCPFFFFNDMPRSDSTCLAVAPSIPGPLFASFQMMFALMTPVIVTGAWAEKLKMEAFVVFMVLWPLLVYYPVAHWIWGGGWMAEFGVKDFAGGITIHTVAGVAAMVVSVMLAPRRNVEKLEMTHHNIPLLVIGGTIIWVGWYSFNGCSALVAGASAGAALLNTHISASVGGLTWVALTYRQDKCFHVTDMMNGAFAGLAGVTPGSGYIPSQAAFCYGIIIGAASWYSCHYCKKVLKIDDVLDVFSLQAVPGALGSIMVGFFAGGDPFFPREGDPEHPGADHVGIFYGGNGKLLYVQTVCVVVASLVSAVSTFVIMKVMEHTCGTEITWKEEEEGLDKSQIGEIGYDYVSPHDTLPMDSAGLTTELIQAAAEGNLGKCKSLQRAGAGYNRGDYDGRTPLHLAASEGRLEVVKWLLSCAQQEGDDSREMVNAVDAFGGTPLQDAMEHGHKAMIAFLKAQGGEVKDESKFTGMLCQAAFAGDSSVVSQLLDDQGVDIDSADYDQRTALHVAAAAGNKSIVGLLLFKGANAGLKDRWGQCAVDGAAESCVAMLTEPIDRSMYADIGDQRQQQKKTKKGSAVAPTGDESKAMSMATKELLEAAAGGNLKAIMALVKRGGDCASHDYDRRTPLHLAAASGHLPMVRFLIGQKKVLVNCLDRFSRSPLQEAAKNGFDAVAEFLKKKGASVMDQRAGFTLCTSASQDGIEKLEEMLMHGVDLSTSDYDGRTALHIAASEGNFKTLSWLLEQESAQASLNAVDRMHNTPLDAAESSKFQPHDVAEKCANALRNAGGMTWANLVGVSGSERKVQTLGPSSPVSSPTLPKLES